MDEYSVKFYVLVVENCQMALKKFDSPTKRKKYMDKFKNKYGYGNNDNWVEFVFDGVIKYKAEDLKVEQR